MTTAIVAEDESLLREELVSLLRSTWQLLAVSLLLLRALMPS